MFFGHIVAGLTYRRAWKDMELRKTGVSYMSDIYAIIYIYKDPMSFEKSASIMRECMGTQFDPNLKAVFNGCREKLEEYYNSIDA